MIQALLKKTRSDMMNNYENIYDNIYQPTKTTIPKEIETIYYDQFGQSPKKRLFKAIRRSK